MARVGGRWQRQVTVVVLVALGAVFGCSHRGIYHRVRPGDTLYRIGKAYGVSTARLAHANHLSDASRIAVGQRLFIPGARRELPVDVITPKAASSTPPRHDEAPSGPVRFAWPVAGGTVTSGYGQRGHSFHDGIDISAHVGTPVRAADDGEVVYSDVLRGYGNVIIVRHTENFATVYAHNQRNQTHEGQRVHRGEVIGSVGESGRTTGSNLHFEVRQDNVARNPLYFLPVPAQIAAPRPSAGRGG